MPDGCRLAARIWLPEDAEADPVPAILEYLPYRKRDGTIERDHLTHPYFAGHGYACVRVDMRGTGEADGVLEDEYSAQELADGVEVINWIAAQDLVHRQGRHDGHLVGRLQWLADCRAGAGAVERPS
jgi:putative CocE/NonD family hydrolase